MDRKRRYQALFDNINQYNSGEKGITRIAYTNEEQTCTSAFMRMCKTEHLDIRMDPCGNVIARRKGKIEGLPPVVMGSHLDTVYQGGKYDGVVGVTAALEVIKRLNEKGIETDHPIEIISFACEESSRFGISTVGSKVMSGRFQKEKYKHLKDKDGITMEKAFSLCALDYNSIDQASRGEEELKAFFELHIEQGPVLINNNKKIGIVTGIAAPVRLHIQISGKASHSGTTPMNMRKDAFLGASEIALELEKAAKLEQEYGTVATLGVIDILNGAMNVVPGEVEIKIDIRSTSVASRQRVLDHLYVTISITPRVATVPNSCSSLGVIDILNGAMNVVPGEVEIKIDIRSTSVASRQRVLDHLYVTISSVQERRQLEIASTEIISEEPVLLSEGISHVLESICEEKGIANQRMISGAGHDAMNMNKLCPVGLIFVPSVDGLSHHPNEYTDLDDIMLGIDILEEAVIRYASVSQT